MNRDYIYLDNLTVVIVRDEEGSKFYKEINGELVDLSKEEKEYVDSLFVKDKEGIYYGKE